MQNREKWGCTREQNEPAGLLKAGVSVKTVRCSLILRRE
jgi:hypothetical protein